MMVLGRQKVDTRSVRLGQTGSQTVTLHLTSSNLTEWFLPRNNGMAIGRGAEHLTLLMDSPMAGWEMSAVTTELRSITFGFEPAHKWNGRLL